MAEVHRTAAWAALVKRVRPRFQQAVNNGMAVCINCGRLIYPGEGWAIGHRMDASLYPEHALQEWNLGPTHHGRKGTRTCNQKAGGRLGAARTNQARKRKTEGGLPEW